MQMANEDITIYNKWYNRETRLDEWIRTQISGVSWHSGQAVTVGDKGLFSANTYTVRIPVSSTPCGIEFVLPENYSVKEKSSLSEFWTIQSGDIVVKGLVDDEIKKASDITQKYSNAFVVTGWKDNRRGPLSTQHWRIDGK